MALTDMTFRPAAFSPRLAFVLPAHAGSVAAARSFVRAHLTHRGCGDDARDSAALVISELFTNALRYTPSATIGCVVHAGDTHVRIEVQGKGSGDGIAAGPVDTLDVRGRGLFIVQSLAVAWGVQADGLDHTVWCTLPHDAP